MGSFITILIYRDFVSVNDESIDFPQYHAHFKLSVEFELLNLLSLFIKYSNDYLIY